MADIRINALATTASASSSDDYIAVDGTTNGTRKLSAYSPTFGGNLTVSGTGTGDGVSYNILAGGSKRIYIGYNTTGDYGAINVAETGVAWRNLVLNQSGGNVLLGTTTDGGFKLDVNGTARIQSNLTVSGGSIVLNSGGTAVLYFGAPSNNYLYFDGSSLFARVGGADRLTISASSGNVLLGTTTDSGALLQVGTNTVTAAGGMVFGTDTKLYRSTSGYATLESGLAGQVGFQIKTSGNAVGTFGANATDLYVDAARTGGSMFLRTNGSTTALTLDSSQRCILAGALRLNNAYTAGAPTATGYVTIQDSAGNTYKVLVGT